MKRNRDFYTPLLPFEEPRNENNEKPLHQDLEKIFLDRLAHFLKKENNIKNFPILKILPSLNKTLANSPIKFTEDQAANLFETLGAEVKLNPAYLGRSRYRVTISAELAKTIINNYFNK